MDTRVNPCAHQSFVICKETEAFCLVDLLWMYLHRARHRPCAAFQVASVLTGYFITKNVAFICFVCITKKPSKYKAMKLDREV